MTNSAGTQQFAQMTPRGSVTHYSVPAGYLESLVTGSDGNVWFTEDSPTWTIDHMLAREPELSMAA